MDVSLSIEVHCEHCGVDSGKNISTIQDGVRVWVPPIFLAMRGKEKGRERKECDDDWYLCLRCWVEGARPKASATAIVEPAPAA